MSPRRSGSGWGWLSAGAALGAALALARWLREPPRGRTRALFPRWANAALLLVLGTGGAAAALGAGWLLRRANEADPARLAAPAQPVPFSHPIHAGALEIDCRYCHASAERTAPAGMPSTRACVPCHERVWLESPAFAAVRASLAEDRPIPWRRVHDLPDFTYFHHGIHSRKGIGCETCHGRVDRMPRVRQAVPLTMGWCLDCHREPERHLRPRSEITTLGWRPDRPQAELGAELKAAYGVSEPTHCTACHR